VAVVIPELRIKKTVTEYYPAAVITEPRVSIKIKFIISINIFYTPTKSREDIKTKDAQEYRRLEELKYF
jgi:hypothetical protein